MFDVERNLWVHRGQMLEGRVDAAAAMHPSIGFVITGGHKAYPESWNYIGSSEATWDGISFQPFTPLPMPLASHCLVTLANEHGDFLLVGGFVDQSTPSRKTYIHQGNSWHEKADKPTQAWFTYACGSVPAVSTERLVGAVGDCYIPTRN